MKNSSLMVKTSSLKVKKNMKNSSLIVKTSSLKVKKNEKLIFNGEHPIFKGEKTMAFRAVFFR